MTLDNEQQRVFLMEMFKHSNFPGVSVDAAYFLKKAIESAKVEAAKSEVPEKPILQTDNQRGRDARAVTEVAKLFNDMQG
jgi:adenine-specific DNA methylase